MERSCHTCNKTEGTLSRCGRCETLYCSRDCQAKDWAAHKKTCARSRNTAASSGQSARANTNANANTTRGLEKCFTDNFTRIDKGTYLHDRPAKDVYKLLIDIYRLRMDDMDKFEGVHEPDSLYAPGVTDSLPGFQTFLRRARAKQGLLPSWWSDEKERECEALGSDPAGWYSLRNKVDKASIINHYGEQRFPMQLRMVGEAIYGVGPGGTDGTSMRKMMMATENEQLQ